MFRVGRLAAAALVSVIVGLSALASPTGTAPPVNPDDQAGPGVPGTTEAGGTSDRDIPQTSGGSENGASDSLTPPSPSQTNVIPLPAPSRDLRRSAYGVCPGSPPAGGGMERRPDTARDPAGALHMVWAERFDGQFDLCYARKLPGREMGVGADANPAFRITNTPGDSVAPRIAIDAVTGISYVAWTEVVPTANGGSGFTELAPVITYLATDLIHPSVGEMALVGGGLLVGSDVCSVGRFAVDDGLWQLEFRSGTPDWAVAIGVEAPDTPCLGGPGKIPSMEWKGSFDADWDGWRDSIEITCPPYYGGGLPPECPDPIGPLPCPDWANADTDRDWIPDEYEFRFRFDPCLRVDLEFPDCFPFFRDPKCRPVIDLLCLFVDADLDGRTGCEEESDYPVTTEVTEFSHGANATYRFWPKVNGNHSLVLRHQDRTPFPGPGCTGVTLGITADGAPVGAWTKAWSADWSSDTVAYLDLTGIDFTAVTAAMAVDVRLDVSLNPPGCGAVIPAAFALDWLKLELTADRSEVNCKDADDFLVAPFGTLVNVFTEDMTISLDPVQRDLLFELDSMEGHDWDGGVLNEVINAFSDLNIVVNYRISEAGLPTDEVVTTETVEMLSVEPSTFTSTNEASLYLAAHRDLALQALGYVHVMNVHEISAGCGIAEQSAGGGLPEHSGALLPDQMFLDGLCPGATNLFAARLAVFLHEVGHTLGAAHDTTSGTVDPLCIIDDCAPPPPDDLCNAYNVMGYTYCFPVANSLFGTGNFDRRAGAAQPIGRSRFSYESEAQFDFANLLSVDVGNNIDALWLFV